MGVTVALDTRDSADFVVMRADANGGTLALRAKSSKKRDVWVAWLRGQPPPETPRDRDGHRQHRHRQRKADTVTAADTENNSTKAQPKRNNTPPREPIPAAAPDPLQAKPTSAPAAPDSPKTRPISPKFTPAPVAAPVAVQAVRNTSRTRGSEAASPANLRSTSLSRSSVGFPDSGSYGMSDSELPDPKQPPGSPASRQKMPAGTSAGVAVTAVPMSVPRKPAESRVLRRTHSDESWQDVALYGDRRGRHHGHKGKVVDKSFVQPVLLGDAVSAWKKRHATDEPIAGATKKWRNSMKVHKQHSLHFTPQPKTRFKVNVMGEVIYKSHPSWVLMHQMQIGIRHVVGKEHITKEQVDLLGTPGYWHKPEFYHTPEIMRFPSSGSAETVKHQMGDFKFKDYCPLAFRYVRALFGVDRLDYLASLCYSTEEGGNPLRLMATPGKSGSLFFFSADMRFIIKTIPKSEAKLLRSILPPYVEHIARNPNTLLPRFYGLHRVKPHKGSQVRFVIMANLFATGLKVHEKFDLKGSLVGRYVTPAECSAKGGMVTLKEGNLEELGRVIHIGPRRRDLLLEQLRADSAMLKELGIMDYSLLVGIHYDNRPDKERCEDEATDDEHSGDEHDGYAADDGGEMRAVKRDQSRKIAEVSTAPQAIPTSQSGDTAHAPALEEVVSTSAPASTVHHYRPSRLATEQAIIESDEDKANDRTKPQTAAANATEPSASTSAGAGGAQEIELEHARTHSHTHSHTKPEFLSMAFDLQPQAANVQYTNTGPGGEVDIVSLAFNDVVSSTEHEALKPPRMTTAEWYAEAEGGGMQSRGPNNEPGHEVYFLGIIDILMMYTVRKVVERVYKTIRYRGQGAISSCPPDEYSERFVEYLSQVIQ